MRVLRFIAVGSIIIISAALAGCANNKVPMANVAVPKVLAEKDSSKATMVFYWTSFWGTGLQAALYDVTDDDPGFIGVISANEKIAYVAPPGKRRYMVIHNTAHFMDANTSAGRTYYVLVSFRKNNSFVVRPNRFELRPMPAWKLKRRENLDNVKWAESTRATQIWAEKLERDTDRLRREDLVRWQKSISGWSPRKKRKRSINPEDGE